MRAVAVIRRRIALALGLSLASRAVVAWALVTGTLALALRAGLGTGSGTALAVAAPLLLPFAFWAAYRTALGLPSQQQLLAFVDARQGAGGLLAAADVVAASPWLDSLPEPAAFTVRWRAGRHGLILAVACSYAAAGLLLPVSSLASAPAGRLAIDHEINELQAAVQALEQAEVVDPDTAESMQTTLDELAVHASADDPAEAFATLDRTAAELDRLAAGGTEELALEHQRLSEAEALTEALRNGELDLDPARLAEAAATLAELAATAGLNLDEHLLQQLGEAGDTGSLPPELLDELARALDASRKRLVEKLVRLEKVRLVDAHKVKKCRGSGCKKGDGLLAFLDENGDEAVDVLVAAWCNLGGRGGINRGRGDAPLTWKDGTDESGTSFEEQLLPPADLEALDDARLVGITATTPETMDDPTATSGALATAPTAGGSAVRRQLLPHHRRAVQHYFERSSQGGS